ncbi:putative phosphodiesterase [Lactobacillus colini]|uniref:Phosphodiesterase n=1 Tax=Lactobacillus colini TaxID=1819254 RepID=A0ABS4MEE7_9LACO|nr:metallophosphoesterase [Lactobacillus colini]MBP2058019.1 putative phosphodiesterase [Lactobacillus colini]
MITQEKNPKFWVISDTHLIAKDLHDNGQAFAQMQKTSQGKDLYYQEEALSNFVKMANEKKPAAIVVCGDVTFNGERISAQKFAKIFSKLTDTKLLVLPGNHDIYDGWAREFKNNKQYYTGQISPTFWRDIFKTSYAGDVSEDAGSLAYSVQFNPDYLFICLDSNYYSNEESSTAPATAGKIGQDQLSWLKEQLEWGQQQNLKSILFMHHNLYAHNKLVNKNYVVDDTAKLRQLCKQYDVRLVFSGHIHAQHIMPPQNNIPTTEIVTSSFCTTDQGYGVIEVSPNELNYQRCSFDMTPYLSDREKKNWTLTHFRSYLKNLQLGALATELVQSELKKDPQGLDLVREMGHIFGGISYNFFIGQNHISYEQIDHLHASPAYQKLINDYPRHAAYLNSLYDTSQHSNLKVIIKY